MTFLLTLIAAILLNAVFVAWFRRLKQGKFNVTLNSRDLYRFETILGNFQINRKHGRFSFVSEHGAGHCLLKDISHVGFEINENYALFEELLFGLNLSDAFEEYRDTIDYFLIHIKTKDGMQFPIYTASQYRQREFLFGWYIEMQENVLERVGLFRDGFKYSRWVHNQLWRAFEASGVVPGGTD